MFVFQGPPPFGLALMRNRGQLTFSLTRVMAPIDVLTGDSLELTLTTPLPFTFTFNSLSADG